jgi:stage V sporulation protein B
VVLTRLIGAQGVGLFRIVFPILGVVLTFVTAGLPTAISKLVAEAMVSRDRVRVARILRVSSTVILSMALLFTLLMVFGRGFIESHWLSDQRAYPSYLVMIPLVGIISVSSIYRGYFQGLQDMSPPAWASIIEQTVRILSIWALALHFVKYSLEYAAAAAMAGMVLGEFAGLMFLVVQYLRRGRLAMVLPDAPVRSLETTKQTLWAIGEIAVPVTLSRLIGSVMYAIEPILVTRALLKAGLLTEMATALYGQYSGMAIPLFVFPTVFTSSLAFNLVPSVSEAIADRAHERVRIRLAQSWRVTAMVAFPSSIILTVFAEPLCRIIFKEPSVAPILAVLAPSGFLLYLQAPLTGILQGLNRAGLSMLNSCIGGVVRLGLIYILASNPHLKIIGVAWAVTISIIVTTALHFVCVCYLIGCSVRVVDTVKIAVASLTMLCAITMMAGPAHILTPLSLVLVTLSTLLLYAVLLCAFQVITSTAVRRIPRVGPTLSRWMLVIPFAK